MRIAGVVLAGGRSRRFGRDKALEPLEGRPLINWSLETLRPATVALAVNGPKALADRVGLACVEDCAGADGPLAGVLGGLRWALAQECTHLMTVPCDTPFLPLDLASRLAAAIGDRPMVAASAARVHALCALWRVDAVDPLLALASEPDQPSMQAIIQRLGGGYVNFPDEAAFANLNTPADFLAARVRSRRAAS